jgi:adenylylsulfate kinase-like enzyme
VIVWFIGLSGSGKSHLGRILFNKIKGTHKNVVFIDGDEFRKLMMNDLGYTDKDREINGWRIVNMCHWLVKQNINVIASFLSNYPDQQEFNKIKLGHSYYQVYVKSNIETLKRKSLQKVYNKDENIVGVDILFNEPIQCNKVFLNNYQEETAQNFVDEIYNDIKEKLL